MEKSFSSEVIIALEMGGTNIKTLVIEYEHICKNNLKDVSLEKGISFSYKTNDDPENLIKQITNDLLSCIRDKKINLIKSVGISCFGPLGLSKKKSDYGKILFTPKKAWINFDLLENISKNLNIKK